MLFGAGLGTRMGALTASRPKPLIPVAGRALVDHALDVARGAGCDPIVVNTHYRAAMLKDHLSGRGLLFSDETPDILETGGGLRQALPLLGPGPVATLNSDAVWTGQNPLAQLSGAWDAARMDGLLLLLPAPAAVGHSGAGDFLMADDGGLARAAGAPGLVYLGAQILKTDDLADLPERAFSLNLVWNRMIARGRLFGLVHQGGWCDVGRPEGIALAEALLAGRAHG